MPSISCSWASFLLPFHSDLMNSSHPLLPISTVFLAWKSIVLILIWLSPGQGYDTSTSLLVGANRLVRWDAIYFVQKAQHGDVFEQEWAFGKGLSTLLSSIAGNDVGRIVSTSIIISHSTHYLSVILLWLIARALSNTVPDITDASALPVIAACLHIISPAGVFLSAPYAEAPFSCLNMLGFWLYLQAKTDKGSSRSKRRCMLLLSGISFGCATMMRSNGILSGLPFLLDACALSLTILGSFSKGEVPWSAMISLAATVIAGLCIAAGLVYPQYLAYQEYCTVSIDARPWCYNRLPLIYSFVQSHYWYACAVIPDVLADKIRGVGFLRYWTLSNVPLFLLAIPVLLLLLWSGSEPFTAVSTSNSTARIALIRRLALPQIVLAVLAITSYHVQIITRLASGYPWLYIWLARRISDKHRYSRVAVQFFVLYALIQAGLFASFLPPA